MDWSTISRLARATCIKILVGLQSDRTSQTEYLSRKSSPDLAEAQPGSPGQSRIDIKACRVLVVAHTAQGPAQYMIKRDAFGRRPGRFFHPSIAPKNTLDSCRVTIMCRNAASRLQTVYLESV